MNTIVNLILIAVAKVQVIPTRIRSAMHIRKLEKQLNKELKELKRVN